MTAMHTDDERAYLLRLAGVKDADAAALVRTPPQFVIEEPIVEDLADQVSALTSNPALNPALESEPEQPVATVELLVQAILAKSKGDKATALRMIDAQVKAEFDRIKLSKLQAAAQGLTSDGKTEHNRNAWARCQKLGEQMKAAVREHHRTNGGFVTAKIKSSTRKQTNV